MRILKTAALALALAAPGMAMAATDGTLGATSTGTVNVSLSVLPDTSQFVQIAGLNDINLGEMTANPSGLPSNFIGSFQDYFCVFKSTLGSVILSIDQPEKLPQGGFVEQSFEQNNYYSNEITNGTNVIPIGLNIRDSGNNQALTPVSNKSWRISNSPIPGVCPQFGAVWLDVVLVKPNISAPIVEGQYSNTFTLTVIAE